ncbi:MAG: response regulator [Planctomycetes bacterium]|nr:response regulator [Planctomycetota bacterium]
MNALVIDDSRVMRKLLRGLLEGCGFAVADAADGEAGIQALAAGTPPELILLDWNMPGMSGIDVVRHLRADARFARTRIVMVTTETSVARMTEALVDGADEYLMKPFVREALVEKLRLVGLPVGSASPGDGP